MAIESQYWKEELARIAKTFRPTKKPERLTERRACTVERDVMIGFFIVRRMIELKKISSRIAKSQIGVFSSPTLKTVSRLTRFSIEKNYDWQLERAEQKPILYISNQCIHAYISYVLRDSERNWSDLIVVSDFDRNKVIWRIPFRTIIGLFESVSKDWVSRLDMTFDPSINDFVVSTD